MSASAQNIIELSWPLQEFKAESQEIVNEMMRVYETGKKVASATVPIGANGWADLSKSADIFRTKLEEIQATEIKLTQATENLNKSIVNHSKATAAADKDSRQHERTLKDLERQKRAEAKLNDELTNEYKNFSRALKDAEARYSNLYLAGKANTEAGKEALAQVTAHRKILDELDQSMGNHQRSVGNYGKAFYDFSLTLRGLRGPTKLLGEWLGIGAQEADQFRLIVEHAAQGLATLFRGKEKKAAAEAADTVATEANTAATAQNTTWVEAKNVSITKGVVATEAATIAENEMTAATTRLSLSMRILRGAVIGLGFLAALAGIAYVVYEIYKFNEAAKKANEQSRIMAELNESAAKSIGEESAKLVILKGKIEDVNRPMSERVKLVNDIREQYPEYFKGLTTEQILAGNVADAYERVANAIVQKARAMAAESKIQEFEAKKFKIMADAEIDQANTIEKLKNAKASSFISQGNGMGVGSSTYTTSLEEAKKLITEQFNLRQKGRQEEVNELNTAEYPYLKFAIQGDEKVAAIKEKSAKKSLQKLTDQYNSEFEIYRIQQARKIKLYEEESQNEHRSFEERMTALRAYYRENQDLSDADMENEKAKATLKLAKDVNAAKGNKKEIEILTKNYKQQLLLIEAKYEDEMLAKEADFYKKKEKLAEVAAKNGIQQVKDEVAGKADAEDTYTAEQIKKKAAAKKESEKLMLDAAADSANKTLGFIKNLVDNGYDKQIKALERLIELNNELSQNEIDRISKSTLSEQEKTATIAQMQAKNAERNRQLEEEQRQRNIKKARTDKEIAIAQIILNTAVAVTKAITEGDPYTKALRAFIAGAEGAAQLAIAVATPIPTYGEGTDWHKGGPALTGEKKVNGKYQPEQILIPGQDPFIVDQPTIFGNLPAGTKVKPLSSDEINQAMYSAMIEHTVAVIGDRTAQKIAEQTEAIKEGHRAMISAIKQQKPSNLNLHLDSGWNAYILKSVVE